MGGFIFFLNVRLLAWLNNLRILQSWFGVGDAVLGNRDNVESTLR